jgi:uncharacterized membrane protein YphA (DoxX/SURF4 family)
MRIATLVLSVLLAVLFVCTGAIKVFNTAAARSNLEHLGVGTQLSRIIGVCELAATVGLLAGLAFRPLSIVTAAAVCVLMAGAIGYHLKARDKLPAMLPAVITAAAAIAVLVLSVAA